MKKFALTLCAAAISLAVGAVPAKRGVRPVTQPDGSVVMIERLGDENHHFTVDQDGQLLKLASDGFYRHAAIDGIGRMVESETPVKLTPELAGQNYRYVQSARRKAPRRVGQIGKNPYTSFPGKGEQKALILLVEFSDKKFTLGDARGYFTDMLSEDGFCHPVYGGTGSCRDYFIESSMGQFVPQFDVYGPVTLPHTCAYYGANDDYGDDIRPAQMVIDACDLLDSEIDFSQYDRDGDMWIDNVFVFYAGQGEASYGDEDTIWPHAWSVYAYDGQTHEYDGVFLDSYGCTNEWEDERPDGIGTFVHEFSHVIGLPDLYNTERVTYVTPGQWSVLDYGPYNNEGRTPPAYSAFERNAMGWIELTELKAGDDVLELPDLRTSNRAYCISNPDDANEFYLIENRQQAGTDYYLPGHGMLIWHVDYNENDWYENTVNNNNSHLGVDLVEADGKASKTERDGGDAYPGTAGVTKATPAWWSGRSAGVALSSIAESADGMISFVATENNNGGGDINNPPSGDYLTVADVCASVSDQADATVRGYIVGWIKGGNFHSGANFNADASVATNLILADSADESDTDYCIPVQLPSGSVRSALNLVDNPSLLGRYVELTGTVTAYFGERGLKSVSAYRLLADPAGINGVVAGADEAPVIYDLQGRRLAAITAPGIYVVNGRKIRF